MECNALCYLCVTFCHLGWACFCFFDNKKKKKCIFGNGICNYWPFLNVKVMCHFTSNLTSTLIVWLNPKTGISKLIENMQINSHKINCLKELEQDFSTLHNEDFFKVTTTWGRQVQTQSFTNNKRRTSHLTPNTHLSWPAIKVLLWL